MILVRAKFAKTNEMFFTESYFGSDIQETINSYMNNMSKNFTIKIINAFEEHNKYTIIAFFDDKLVNTEFEDFKSTNILIKNTKEQP